MAMVCAAIAGLAASHHEDLNISDPEYRLNAATQLIAKIPTIAAMAYRKSVEKQFVEPNADLSYAENFCICVLANQSEPEVKTLSMLSTRFSFYTQTTNKTPLLLQFVWQDQPNAIPLQR